MDRSEYYNQSIKRAIQIMHLFNSQEKELSLAEISRKMDIHKSIVYRILITLESEGWLVKNPETNKYMLGIKLLLLSSVVLDDLVVRKTALPIMKKLSAETGETVVLTMYSDGGAICIEKIESDNSIKITSQVGKFFPLHAGATGLAVLMGMPDEIRKEILKRKPLEKFTEKTETDPDKIIKLVEEAKKDDYIISVGSVDPGVVAIGIPINFTQGNIFMGLSITGPEYRFDEQKISFVVDELKKAKKEILLG